MLGPEKQTYAFVLWCALISSCSVFLVQPNKFIFGFAICVIIMFEVFDVRNEKRASKYAYTFFITLFFMITFRDYGIISASFALLIILISVSFSRLCKFIKNLI